MTETTLKNTKQKIIDAAQELMLGKGYVATTVDEICARAEVTKGSFFHYFKNKEDLGHQLVDNFNQCTRDKMQGGISCCGDDPLEKLYGLLDCLASASEDPNYKGCLVGIFSQELSETYPELRAICEKSFDNFTAFFAKLLSEAKEKYPPREDFDPRGLAAYFLALTQGSHIMVKASQKSDVLGQNVLLFKKQVKAIFGR